MIRTRYRINNGQQQGIVSALEATSQRSPMRMPLARNWIVDWSQFFVINGSTPNFSQRIRPTYSSALLKEELFPALEGTGQNGLACLDLVSSIELGLWSVDRLIERLKNFGGGGIGEQIRKCVTDSRFLMDKDSRRNGLAKWLALHAGSHSLCDPNDISALAQEPPLMFFIQYEAWAGDAPDGGELKGTRLGILGSIIVADVIFAALANRGELEDPDLGTSLRLLNERFFENKWDAFSKIPKLTTMSDVIAFVAKLHGLQNAEPKFA
jgi:hypothetical protein